MQGETIYDMKEPRRTIIDVHAHVIPGVDDGARSMDESCQMLSLAAGQGIRTVFATPHYSRRRETPQLREQAARLQEKIREQYPDFKLYVGQETYYHEGLVDRLREGKAYTLADSSYVLVEFGEADPYGVIFNGIRILLNSGYVPILAHMERYSCLRKDGAMRELLKCGCLFQMNYDSLQGSRFDGEVRWCRRQVANGWIHLLGTDMHRIDYRPPDVEGALRWLERHVEEELLEAMLCGNSLCIINNDRID